MDMKSPSVVAVAASRMSVGDDHSVIVTAPLRPRSRQLPRRVEELDGVTFGPLGKHGLLGDEAVPAIGGALMEHVFRTLVPAADFIVVVGNLSDALRSGKKTYIMSSSMCLDVTTSEVCFDYRCVFMYIYIQ